MQLGFEIYIGLAVLSVGSSTSLLLLLVIIKRCYKAYLVLYRQGSIFKRKENHALLSLLTL
ncbi:MAG: hypothetical protein RL427_290 [Bacteroidota bacterium]|jgi:hypothetical protein